MSVKPRRAQPRPILPHPGKHGPKPTPLFQAVIILEMFVGAFVAGVLGAVIIWG